jgi:hypothetical protein
LSQPTCCVACTALLASTEAIAAIERKMRWIRRIQCGGIASAYACAMVVMLMFCFPGRTPALSSLKHTISGSFQVKVGPWQAGYALSQLRK